MLLDPSSNELRMAVSSNIERALWPEIRISPGEGYAGEVARSGEPLLVRRASDVRRAGATGRRYTNSSFMCAPMKVKGRTIGVLNVTNRKRKEPFTRQQLDMLVALANVAALAVENTRLLVATTSMGRRLRDVIEAIGDGVVAVDAGGVILLHNELALYYLGLKSGHYEGLRLGEAVPGNVRTVLATLRERTLAERAHFHEEVEWTIPGSPGAVPLTVSTAPLYLETRGNLCGVVFVFTDMTLCHKVDELKRIEEAKNNFLAIISHELRTPLTSIKGACYLLRHRLQTTIDQESVELLRIVEQNTERLLRDIIDILDVVSIDTGTAALMLRRDANLAAIARQCVERFCEAAQAKNISIAEDYTDCPQTMMLDEEKVIRALEHLVGNAVKFSPFGTRMTVATGSTGREAFVAVRDSGPGIDPVLGDHIFRKFVQGEKPLTRQSRGYGIGLYVARGFAELHGGRIETINLPGGGCEFRLVLALRRDGESNPIQSDSTMSHRESRRSALSNQFADAVTAGTRQEQGGHADDKEAHPCSR